MIAKISCILGIDADLAYQAHLTNQISTQKTFFSPFERINNSSHSKLIVKNQFIIVRIMLKLSTLDAF